MKRTLFLVSLLACCMVQHAAAATYTGESLSTAWADDINHISYDGSGKFTVHSFTETTSIDLTINLSQLSAYTASEAYKATPMILWEGKIGTTTSTYGMGANKGNDGNITLTGWIDKTWKPNTNITYSTLSDYADENGNVTLSIRNHAVSGVTVSATDKNGTTSTLYSAPTLRYSSMTTYTGYTINQNYVTAISINTPSSMGIDYTQTYESNRTDGSSIGRVTFMGDSITHGVNDQSYRWQFFKILTDNGIENEIVGPRTGYNSLPAESDTDKGEFYGGEYFSNVHLAQASGRSYNILTGKTSGTVNGVSFYKGVDYGGNTTASTAATYNSDSWFCMIGTNDLLSDTDVDGTATGSDYASKMQNLLGGTVSYSSEKKAYEWVQGDNWGNLGSIINDVYGEGDTFYMLSIIPWANHFNQDGVTPSHRDPQSYYAAQEYNRLLQEWITAYTNKHEQQHIEYVDVTRGMIDYTSGTSVTDASGKTHYFKSHNDLFNTNSTWDKLHPSSQGSLLMAGNLARHLKIGGRTAGLERMDTAGWESKQIGTVADGTTIQAAENAFTTANGYTIDFTAKFGNGDTDGTWLDPSNALSITLGDGLYSGTLNLSEGYIMWGTDVLFCWDNSELDKEGNLRIAWHNGNTADNILSGYYVWLGDMLIGQGLEASRDITLNGIRISVNGADGEINGLSWTNTAYAPTTNYTTSAEYAYLTTQELPLMSAADRNNTPTSSGVTYGDPAPNYDKGYISTSSSTSTYKFALGNTDKNTSGTLSILKGSGASNSATINTLIAGNIHASLIGVENEATANKLVLETNDAAVIQNNTSMQGAIVASYGGKTVQTFELYVNGGTVGGDIVGGESKSGGTGAITQTNIYINNGTINGNILGGGKSANGSVGNAVIRVNGGTVTGSIIAGGTSGTIGNTDVTITGGIIKGGIEKGAASRTNNGKANVTIIGNKAGIGGNIEADKVTLKDVSKLANYSNGFDNYSGTITTPELVLDNVQTEMSASYDGLQKLSALNGTNTSLIGGDALSLEELSLGAGTTVGIFEGADRTVSTATETMLTVTGSLTIAGEGATLNANLVLTADSTLNLGANSLELGSSLTLGGGALDDATLAAVLGLESGCSLVLFTGVDELIVGNGSYTGATELAASVAFNNAELASPDFRLVYTGATAGGMVSIMSIPEPTTATLSLLALAGLAVRRRRK